MNVVIACGGTGGHLFPGLAVAEKLRERDHQVLIFISEKEIDALAVRDHRAQFRFEKLPSIGLPGIFSPAMVGFVRGFGASITLCRRFYRDFRPHAVLGMGGFTSTGPMLAGCLARVPTFIHESNAIPGKANRFNARLAKVVLLGFAECASYFPRQRSEVTGTPIRIDLCQRPDPSAARQSFGLTSSEGRKTVLVMGGSQGAHGINQAVLRALPLWKDLFQIIHLTGREDEGAVRAAYQQAGMGAYVAAFHHRMQEAYAAADVAISRSGAASLSELAFFGLPSVLIPYPFAAEDHQTYNAEIFVRGGAATRLLEAELTTGDLLATTVRDIATDNGRLAQMSEAAQRLAPADAADRVVAVLEKNCHS
jgi:UDP-N-acetylglucosamine--N-acetylmuramyl-(pentapeptide) pyrophosphoryl-undecaprenol N-acetylglucosamine transferase